MDKQLENLERYNGIAQENKYKLQKLYEVRKELENIKRNNKLFLEAKKIYEKELIAKMDKAITNKNFVSAYKIKAKILNQSNNKLFMKINNSVEKMNRLNIKNIELQKKIDKRLENMAKREVLANSFIDKKIASFKNGYENLRLKFEIKKSDNINQKINFEKQNHNDSVQKSQHYQNLLKNKDLLNIKKLLEKKGLEKATLKSNDKSKPIDQSKMQDFTKEESINPRTKEKRDIYTHKNLNVKVIDNGNFIVAKGGTDKEKAQALLKVAKEKGWNINNLVATGSKDFKNELNKLIEIEKIKKQEQLKQLEQMKQKQAENKQKTTAKNKSTEKTFSLQK